MKNDQLQCLICNKFYSHLGSHVVKGHKITARDYKERFELDYDYPLISAEIKRKLQISFEEDRKKYLDNLMKFGKKYRFKKGVTNRTRFALQSIYRATDQIKGVNRKMVKQNCPVCRMSFPHLESHLYNKHGLVLAKK